MNAADLTEDVKLTCTLTGTSPDYGTVYVDENMNLIHAPAEADANDTLHLENGILSVETPVNEYELNENVLSVVRQRLNGSVTAEAWVYTAAPEKLVEFKYDTNGLRTQKKVTDHGQVVTTDYIYHGRQLAGLTCGNDTLHFFYDVLGCPAQVQFNGVAYAYVHSFQNDVIGILDSCGNLVVEYRYDAWGRLLTATGFLAEALDGCNPFRYRGYVYDGETGLYYLQGRYYNSEFERFLNADVFISNGLNVLGKNSFAYCFNCPMLLEESTGAWPKWVKVVAAAVTVVAVTAVCVATAGAAAAAIVGAQGVMTAAGAAAVGAVKTATAVGGLMMGGTQIVTDIWDGDDDISVLNAATETISGCTYGMVNGLTGGSAPILAQKWIGPVGRAMSGAATAAARGIRNGDSIGKILQDMGRAASIPIAMGYFGRNSTNRGANRDGLLKDPSIKTMLTKALTAFTQMDFFTSIKEIITGKIKEVKEAYF